MAGEPRVTRLTAQIAYSGTNVMADGPRVNRLQAQAVYGDRTNPVQVTRMQGQAVYADRTNPVRVSLFQVQVLRSISSTDLPVPVDPTKDVKLLTREANPYKPTLPSEVEAVDPILYDYLRDQAETVRKQHDTTQAGDSTFGWEWLTKVGPQQLFTLGSLGRFYHDSYGIILARYCKFTQWEKTDFVCCPVGRLASDEVVSWTVTNDFTLSGPDKVLGILGSRTAPNEGEYGWVLTQGANHFALQVPNKTVITEKESELVWSSTGMVSGGGKGRILGRVQAPSVFVHEFQTQMEPGTVYLGVEGPSIDSLKAMLPDYSDLPARVADLEKLVSGGQAESFAKTLAKLTKTVQDLDDRESEETITARGRLNDVETSLEKVIASLGGDTLAGLYRRITEERNLRDDGQDEAIRKAANLAQDALTIAKALQNADYQGQIDKLRASLNGQVKEGYLIPVVTGQVPPVFVYLPDGNLVFVRIES